jgi:hypothetical protein
MLLIYSSERVDAHTDPADAQAIMMGHKAVMEGTMKAGILRGGEPLHPTSTSTTVRQQNGKPITLDGPFAETKEQLAGYYILDCKDLDEAIYWAGQIPTGCKGSPGCVEIRPIMDIPKLEEAVNQAVAQAR